MRVIRAGQIFHIDVATMPTDPTWTITDKARWANIQARWRSQQRLSPEEQGRLLECAVWKRKLPGLTYTSAIESQLQQNLP
jgi:hypothetical protein